MKQYNLKCEYFTNDWLHALHIKGYQDLHQACMSPISCTHIHLFTSITIRERVVLIIVL